jgi:hypothetical protein
MTNEILALQSPARAQAMRSSVISWPGWLASARKISQPCFLAVEMSDRMVLKSSAPSMERKPPDIWQSYT